MANAFAAAPHHPAGVPVSRAGVRFQAANEGRKAAAGFPDPSEVCSTLLARDDSAVDEALKLYWK